MWLVYIFAVDEHGLTPGRCSNCGASLRRDGDRFICDYCGAVFYPSGTEAAALAVLGPVATGKEDMDNALARRSLLALADIARSLDLPDEARRAERMAMNLPPSAPDALAGLPDDEILIIRAETGAIALRRTRLSLVRLYAGLYFRIGVVDVTPTGESFDAGMEAVRPGPGQAPASEKRTLKDALVEQVAPLLPVTADRLVEMIPDLTSFYASHRTLLTPESAKPSGVLARPVRIAILAFVIALIACGIVIPLCAVIMALLTPSSS